VVRKGTSGRTVRVTADLEGRGGKGIWAPYFLGVIGQFTKDGLLIATAIPDTPAAALGLGKGDLIARINNQPVRTQEEFYAVLNDSGGQATLVVRSGKTGRVGTLDVDLTTYQLGALGEFTRDGMAIATVAPGTPAERCGLQRGDVIVRIDNQPVRDQDEFKTVVNNSGGTVTLAVRKAAGGRPVLLQVDLMNNPLGAWCEPDKEGMRITAVARESSAGRIGLERGDVILKIDDERVRSQQDLLAALYNSGGFITMAVRKGQTGRVVKLEADLAR
jgi:S1-C subfamily serine protease